MYTVGPSVTGAMELLMRVGNLKRQEGFTYLGLLLAIALMGLGLSAASEVWTKTAERQREEQLKWVGAQFVQAIASYYLASPGLMKRYPIGIEDLLADKRFHYVVRHLRQIYVNPVTGKIDWELLRSPDGGIVGVRVPEYVVIRYSLKYSEDFVFKPITDR